MPNNTTKNVSHGITNLSDVILFEGFASTGAGGGNYVALPFIESSNVAYSMNLRANVTQVQIKTNQDNSTFSRGYVTMYYTKTV